MFTEVPDVGFVLAKREVERRGGDRERRRRGEE